MALWNWKDTGVKMLFFLCLFCIAWADCLEKNTVLDSIVPIQSNDIPTLVQKNTGCILLFELWAGWCSSCQQIKPQLQEIIQKHPKITHLSVSADYSEQALRNYLKKHNNSDKGHYLIQNWTVENLKTNLDLIQVHFKGAIPLLILFDAKGKLLYEATEPKDLSSLAAMLQQVDPVSP